MKKKSLLTIFVIVFGLSLVFLSGCQENQDNTPAVPNLKIGSLPIEDTLPILVAEQEGYFTQEDVDVELIPFQSALENQSAVQAGQLDGFITDTVVPVLLRNSGLELKITSLTLGAIPEEGRFAIIASKESGIKTPADLKGKSIGLSKNTIIEYVTDQLLLKEGINPSEVTKTTVAKIPLRVEMLLNNQIDAITVPDPLVTFTEFNGAKIILEDTSNRNLSQAVVVMTEKTLTDKSEAVKRFYKAYSKAVDAINDNPGKFKSLLVENINIPAPIADSYGIQKYPQPQLPEKQDLERVINWLDEKELLQKEITYNDMIAEGFFS
jgi:NitT/TauT family transport system substrate-binding protein